MQRAARRRIPAGDQSEQRHTADHRAPDLPAPEGQADLLSGGQRLIDLDAFASRYLIPYQWRGRKLTPRLCPFCGGGEHGDTNTFSIYQAVDQNGQWVYRCLRGSCGAKGTLKGLVEYFGEEAVAATNRPGQRKLAANHTPTYTPLSDGLLGPRTEAANAYLHRRKLSDATLDACKIACGHDNGPIAIPFYWRNKLVLIKYRRPSKPTEGMPKEWAEAGGLPVMWRIDEIDPSKPVYLTEGMIDAMSLYEAGFTNVISVPSGVGSADQAIDNCWDALEEIEELVIVADSDAPGREMEQRIAQKLGEARCSYIPAYPDITLPNGTTRTAKDANEVLFFLGVDGVRKLVESAERVPMAGIIDISEVYPPDDTNTKRIPSAIQSINACMGGYSPGMLVVWSGKRGDGKSTAVSQEILTTVEHGGRVCVFSGELTQYEFVRWMDLQAAGSEYLALTWDKLRQMNVPTIPHLVQRRIKEWYAGKVFLCESNIGDLSYESDDILRLFDYTIARYNVSVCVVDNLMTAMMSISGDDYYRAQEIFAAKLKMLAVKRNCVIHLIAHPRKVMGSNLGNDDVGGSAAITNLADQVIMVSRGKLTITKDRKHGTINREVPLVYYTDCRQLRDAQDAKPYQYGWNREGLTLPEKPASSIYKPIWGTELPV